MNPGFVLFAALALCAPYVHGFDLMSCYDMVPTGITAAPQNSPSPYAIQVSPALYQDGFPVTVKIEAVDGKTTFNDYLIEALCVTCASNPVPIGAFINIPADAELLNCFDSRAALKASSYNQKTSVEFSWIPPPNFNGIVVMRASVVQTGDVWWGNIGSRALEGKGQTILWGHLASQAVDGKAEIVKRQASANRGRRTTTTTTTEAPSAAAIPHSAAHVSLLVYAAIRCLA